jgi:TRAP-type mannitol/chloroaromatic compound transport system permease small subunit
VNRRAGGGNVQALLRLSGAIDAINTRIGKILSWAVVVAVVVSASNASIRKIFDTSSNAWLELQWVLFSMVFLLCASWTLSSNEHIRIDIVNNLLPKRARNIIDVVGHAFFLLPLTIIMVITSYPFMLSSAPKLGDLTHVLAQFPAAFIANPMRWPANLGDWFHSLLNLGEQSANSGGLPQWPAKSLVLIGFVLLMAQAISELIKRIAVMRGLIDDPHDGGGGLHAAAEAEAERLLAAVRAESAHL